MNALITKRLWCGIVYKQDNHKNLFKIFIYGVLNVVWPYNEREIPGLTTAIFFQLCQLISLCLLGHKAKVNRGGMWDAGARSSPHDPWSRVTCSASPLRWRGKAAEPATQIPSVQSFGILVCLAYIMKLIHPRGSWAMQYSRYGQVCQVGMQLNNTLTLWLSHTS